MNFKFQKPSRPVARCFIHCSASDNPAHDNVATMDAWHKARGWSGVGYHLFERKDGTWEIGRSIEKTPAAQGGNNRGTIAICLHGLAKSKFTKKQLDGLIDICIQINEAYGGKITFHGHNEVAAKLCPVIDYKSVLKLDAVGRLGVTRASNGAKLVDYGDLSMLEAPEADVSLMPTLRIGANGNAVKLLQQRLKVLNYHTGAIDGDFGKMTRASVLAFQADNHLIEDGIVGPSTYEALDDAEAREIGADRANTTLAGLASNGSRIAQAAFAQGFMGTGLTVGGGIAVIEEQTGVISGFADNLGTYKSIFQSSGPWLGGVVAIVGALVILQAIKAGGARREDHRTGKTL